MENASVRRVRMMNNRPTLLLDGADTLPLIYALSDFPGADSRTYQAQKNIAAFRQAGINLVACDTNLLLGWYKAAEGDYDALTSGRYGLLQMKLSDYALLPLWQKALGTGPDATLTFQPSANQLNYCHNSYADMLCSVGFVGFAAIVLYISHLLRRRMFAGEQMTGDTARALVMGRTALLLSAMMLSIHTSRTMLFFLIL